MLSYFVYILLVFYVIGVSKRCLHMLQQNLYNENNRYLKWIIKNKNITIFNVGIFNILLCIALFFVENTLLKSFILLLMMFISLVNYFTEKKIKNMNQNKKPLVYTARIKRLICTLILLYGIPTILGVISNNNIYLLIVALFSFLSFYTVYIALLINHPIERMVYKYYETNAKNKLYSMKQLKVIGITGSYGKTSCKNILNDILSIKYNTLATPKSLNTFNGLMITVNNQLSKFDEVFIAEMGAYVKGEINGLCDLVNPKYGIITSIGTAHLETFGSEENIQKGKMELIEHLPSDGIGVLNSDDPKQLNYKIKNNCKILWIGIDNEDVDVRACNIRVHGVKMQFDVIFKGDKNKYLFETKLLGKHNIYNILAAIALGYALNIDVKDLQLGVKRVKPIEHRLELKKIGKFYQIDDAYNSNPVGAKSALDVLALMDGYKVVVTPGMIELGAREDELNKEFGKQISKVADFVILVGEKKTKPIFEGLVECGYPKDKIKVLNDVRESYLLINKMNEKKDIYALYENDLPDTYNE